jgi:hypothetical protein
MDAGSGIRDRVEVSALKTGIQRKNASTVTHRRTFFTFHLGEQQICRLLECAVREARIAPRDDKGVEEIDG